MINKHIKNKIILISILTTWLVLFEILAIIYGYDALQINSVDWLFKKIEIVFNVTIWIYLILLLVFVFINFNYFDNFMENSLNCNFKTRLHKRANKISIKLQPNHFLF